MHNHVHIHIHTHIKPFSIGHHPSKPDSANIQAYSARHSSNEGESSVYGKRDSDQTHLESDVPRNSANNDTLHVGMNQSRSRDGYEKQNVSRNSADSDQGSLHVHEHRPSQRAEKPSGYRGDSHGEHSHIRVEQVRPTNRVSGAEQVGHTKDVYQRKERPQGNVTYTDGGGDDDDDAACPCPDEDAQAVAWYRYVCMHVPMHAMHAFIYVCMYVCK